MADKHPFDKILDQISDLLKMSQDNKSKLVNPEKKDEKLDPSIGEKLEEIERQVDLFKKITERAMSLSGLDEKTVVESVQKVPGSFDLRDKKVIDRAKKLHQQIESAEKDMSLLTNISKMKEQNKKTEGKKRVKKFKRLGGQGWLPM